MTTFSEFKFNSASDIPASSYPPDKGGPLLQVTGQFQSLRVGTSGRAYAAERDMSIVDQAPPSSYYAARARGYLKAGAAEVGVYVCGSKTDASKVVFVLEPTGYNLFWFDANNNYHPGQQGPAATYPANVDYTLQLQVTPNGFIPTIDGVPVSQNPIVLAGAPSSGGLYGSWVKNAEIRFLQGGDATDEDIEAASAVLPTITTQPLAQSVVAGQTASFTGAATGSPAPTVQWQVSTNGGANFNDIAGATAMPYVTGVLAQADSGKQYRFGATNAAGTVYSNAVALTVAAAGVAPSFSSHPNSLSVQEGQTATFSAASTGTPTPSSQWQVRANSGASWDDIAGATLGSYTTAAVGMSDNGKQYRRRDTNGSGVSYSNAATLTVTAAATGTLRFQLTYNSTSPRALETIARVTARRFDTGADALNVTNRNTDEDGFAEISSATITAGVAYVVNGWSADGIEVFSGKVVAQ